MKIFRELKGIPEPEEKTEAEKAAESFQAEQEHVKQQAPTVEMQEHMKQQAPTVEIQEEEILVNTLREEDLPPELSGKEEASPEHQELEVNTLEGEEARPRQEQKVELIPVTVNMPNLQKPEAPGQMEASETMKEEAKPAVPEAKEEARPVSLEASTPEELGFFPAKKGSGKKGKSIPAKKEASVPKQQPAEEALREKQSGKGQTSSSKPEPEKTEQEAEEDYLDQLLKELK